MWYIICHQYMYRLTYNTASRASGWDGIVVLLDGYEASQMLGHCNTFKFIWSGVIKQMKVRLIWKYVGYYMSTRQVMSDV